MAVYLSGCPLRCAWCHSPESQATRTHLAFVAARCRLCGQCVSACPHGLHRVSDGVHEVRRADCEACGGCAGVCPWGALRMLGRTVFADDIVQQAARLRPFFAHSGGGVTLTGGEVAAQSAFALAVLSGCRALGIHTAIETSGACAWEALEPLVDASDLVLYDVKLIDSDEHQRWTGVPNDDVLANARKLPPDRVQIRVPLVPGITDSEANLEGIFQFAANSGLWRVAVLPYNASAPAKYEWLGRPFPLGLLEPQSLRHLADIRAMGTALGLDVQTEGGREAAEWGPVTCSLPPRAESARRRMRGVEGP